MEPGTKVVVIEDLISTGGSVLEVVDVLRQAGAQVLGIASIFTYGLQKGVERLAAADVVNYSLSDFDTLSKVAAAEGYIADKDIAKLTAFQKEPSEPGLDETVNKRSGLYASLFRYNGLYGRRD